MNDEKPPSLQEASDEFVIAWYEFVTAFASALRIPRLLDWLTRQIERMTDG